MRFFFVFVAIRDSWLKCLHSSGWDEMIRITNDVHIVLYTVRSSIVMSRYVYAAPHFDTRIFHFPTSLHLFAE